MEHQDFFHAMEFGSLWHVCEETAHAGKDWRLAAKSYAVKLRTKYPNAHTQIDYWTAICIATFEVYWSLPSSKMKQHDSVLQEQPFAVPIRRFPGDVEPVILRGKFDSIFCDNKNRWWLQENKTKGEIDEEAIPLVVDQNFQTMIYLYALVWYATNSYGAYVNAPWTEHHTHRLIRDRVTKDVRFNLGGTVYNCIRRPLSKQHAIRQKKSESQEGFIKRIASNFRDNPKDYFFRWTTDVNYDTVIAYANNTLNPIVTQLANWYAECQRIGPIPPHHWRTPFGIYNNLASGLRGDYWDYFARGSQRNLITVTDLFPELKADA
jgi:hypothetical protein